MKMVANKVRTEIPSEGGRRLRRLGKGGFLVGRRAVRKSRLRAVPKVKKPRRIVLRVPPDVHPVNLEYYAPDASLVFVAGSFNGWNPHASPLRGLAGGRWSLRLLLKPGRYEYKFLVDGHWKTDPQARQYVTDFCGSVNSVLVVQ